MGEAKRRRKAPQPSPDSGYFEFSPEAAIEQIKEDPSKAYLTVSDFCKWAKLSTEEFRREAAAGRLTVLGIRRGPMAWSDLHITVANALEWMVNRRMAN